MKNLLSTVRNNRLLFVTGVLHLVLLGVFTILAFADPRQLAGANLWVKPMKFALSIAIYVFTLAWMFEALGDLKWKRIASIVIATALWVETAAIGIQAARGVKSHFNVATPLDGIVYGIMGLAIGVSTVVVLLTAFRFFRKGTATGLQPAMKLAIGLGLLASALFSFEGYAMGSRLAHTVGAPDGGPGLPFLNWALRHGDLRVAHFFGIHALQAIPLAAWLIDRSRVVAKTRAVWAFSILYVLTGLGLFAWAMAGRGLAG